MIDGMFSYLTKSHTPQVICQACHTKILHKIFTDDSPEIAGRNPIRKLQLGRMVLRTQKVLSVFRKVALAADF